jgi:hypothetical protein
MRIFIITFVMLILLFTFISCSEKTTSPLDEEPAFEFPAELTIKYGETLQIPERDLTITFTDVVADWRYSEHAIFDLYELKLLVKYKDYESFKLHVVEDYQNDFLERAFYFNFEPIELESQTGSDSVVDLNDYRFTFTIDSIGANEIPNFGCDPIYTWGTSYYDIHKDSFLLLDIFIVNDTLNAILEYKRTLGMDDQFTLYASPLDLYIGPYGGTECFIRRDARSYYYQENSTIDTIKFNIRPIADYNHSDKYIYIWDYKIRDCIMMLYDGPY